MDSQINKEISVSVSSSELKSCSSTERALEAAGMYTLSWSPDQDLFKCCKRTSYVLDLAFVDASCGVVDFLDCIDPEDRYSVQSAFLNCQESGSISETKFRLVDFNSEEPLAYSLKLWRVDLESDSRKFTIEGYFQAYEEVDAYKDQIENQVSLIDTMLDRSITPSWIASADGVMLKENKAYREFSSFGLESGTGKFAGEYSLFNDKSLQTEQFQKLLNRCFDDHQVVSWALSDQYPNAENNLDYTITLDPIVSETKELQFVLIRYQSDLEAKLNEKTDHMKLLLDMVKAQVWYLDTKGRVVDYNGLAAKETGLQHRQIIGGTIMSLASNWDDPPRRYLETLNVIKTGVPQLGSIQSYTSNENRHWASVDKVPLKNELGEVYGLLMFVYDITQLKSKEKALKESEDRYRAFITTSKDAIFRIDIQPGISEKLNPEEQLEQLLKQGTMMEFNEAFLRIHEYANKNSLYRKNLGSIDQTGFWSELLHKFLQQGFLIENYEWKKGQGSRELWTSTSIIGTVERGNLIRIWGTQRDITERRRHLMQLEYQADHDHLTGLPNRNYFWKKIGNVLQSSRAEGAGAGLLLLDIDRFKEVNDSLGHFCGDTLLMKLGERLDRLPKYQHSFVARLGGDEFAILLERLESMEQAKRFAQKLLEVIRKPVELAGLNVEVGGSIGISLFPWHGEDGAKLLRCADVAMYQAKGQSTGYAVYNEDLDEYSPERLSIISDLGQALRNNELSLHFQPKIDLKRPLEEIGFEALIRWNHPTLGPIPPGRFIPYIELSDMIRPLTLWVLESAMCQWKAWKDQGIISKVSVNLSTRNLIDDSIVRDVSTLMQRYGVLPWCLELEITESAIMTDYNRALKVLEKLHELKVRLSIDDFGTGYSSLAYLKRLPVHSLKIDLSFVQSMLQSEPDEIIVNSTITMAHNLGLEVVAEGVEDHQTLEMLQDMGCDQVQGYYFSRPENAETMTTWIEENFKAKGLKKLFMNSENTK